MEMNERIATARKAAGYNKSELARTLDVTPTSCSSWELPVGNRNTSRPGVTNLGRLALILNVRFEWLATGRGPMAVPLAASRRRKTPASESDRADSLLMLYRSLSAGQRGTVLDFMRLISAAPAQPQASNRASHISRTAAQTAAP